MSNSRAVGIDLGTTTVAISTVDEMGRSGMVRDPQGDLLIPSTVYFEDDEVVFGRAAKQAASLQPSRSAEWVKRDLGQAAYSRAIAGELLRPELIEGFLLEYICTNLTSQLSARPAVTFSVPASFNQSQRRALADAAQIGGVDMLGTINDTLAAALAFGETQGYLNPTMADKAGSRVLVFDLGAGMLDVAIIEIKPQSLRTMAVGGEARLGGRDWDARLADHLAEEFAKQHGEDPRYDMTSVRRLLALAEETKQTLSARQQARVRVERTGKDADISVSRQAFDRLTADFVDQCRSVTEGVIGQSGMAWRDVSQVLVAGGATRMPMIGKMLEQLTGIKPVVNLHPDEAVARGAALYGECLLGVREGRLPRVPIEIVDLTPHSLGFEWNDPKRQEADNVVLIQRGSELPCSTVAKLHTTMQPQGSLSVQLLEGESRRASECVRFAKLTIRGIPDDLPKNSPIEMQYKLTGENRLQVKAIWDAENPPLPIEVERNLGLNKTQIADWRALVARHVGLKAILEQLDQHRGDAPEQIAVAASAPPPIPGQPPALPHDESELGEYSTDEFDELMARSPRRRAVTPRKIAIIVIGYLTSAALGLLIGYYILMMLRPEYNYFDLRLPGVARELPVESPPLAPAPPER